MAGPARVQNIDALRALKAALFKFAESSDAALADADAEMRRTLTWLESEQPTYWQSQLRKRTEIVARCRDAVRQKKLFKDSSGRTPSAAEEEKALAIAQRRLAEAQQRFEATRKWSRKLAKEIELYRGSVQRFQTTVEQDIPTAAAKLDRIVAALEAYMSLNAASTAQGAAAGSGEAAMSRAPDQAIAPPPQEPAEDQKQPPADDSESPQQQ